MISRIILISLMISLPLFGQFSSADRELVKMNFTGKTDTLLLNSYLNSNDPQKIKAALLSISRLEDTLFAERAASLSFAKYGDYIAFTLGQLGPSSYSTRFLIDKIKTKQNPFLRECFEAAGKTGDLITLKQLLKLSGTNKKYKSEGLPLALANFSFRGIRVNDSSDIRYLISQLKSKNINIRTMVDALYSLYRLGGSKDAEDELVKIVSMKDGSNDQVITAKQYALSALRRTKHFPQDISLLKSLLSHRNWIIRTEAVRAACYYYYTGSNELDVYLTLLRDNNPNVSRQAAISLKEINCSSQLKSYLINQTEKLLSDTMLTANCRGELFITLAAFLPGDLYQFADRFKNTIGNEYIVRAVAENQNDPGKNLKFLKGFIASGNPSIRIEAWTAVMALSGKLKEKQEISETIFSGLNSSDPAVLTIVSGEIDSAFIAANGEKLAAIIPSRINKLLHLPDYQESMVSLAGLSKRIDPVLYKNMLEVLGGSDVTALRSFAFRESGLNIVVPRDTLMFHNIWSNSFKYKNAVITTSRGTFTIEFFPEIAPVTAGNFCYLAQTGVFRNSLFHRVVPGFVIQTGDPLSTGWGGPGYSIISEYSPLPFEKGYVGMASSGKDTEGSQWFVMHGNFPHLNTRYTNFGKVTEGMDIANVVDQGDRVLKIELK